MARQTNVLSWSLSRLWLRPAGVGLALLLGVTLGSWGLTAGLASRIESQREKLTDLKHEIAAQQATVRELEKKTWGVGYQETAAGRFLTLPESSEPGWTIGAKPAVRLSQK